MVVCALCRLLGMLCCVKWLFSAHILTCLLYINVVFFVLKIIAAVPIVKIYTHTRNIGIIVAYKEFNDKFV